MDPYEERLRDEVIYLHSLWHQGPPRPSNPNPIAVSRPANIFKKHHHLHDHNYRMVHQYSHPPSPLQPTSSLEWPVDTAPPKPAPRWPLGMKADSAPKQDAGSPSNQAKLFPGRMQREVLATFRMFLEKINSEDGSDDEDDDDVAVEECKEYRFFLEVFVSNAPLREYFEKHHEDGEFWCFACEKNKKFKSCHALLQHLITISKTDRKRAHNALALVICRVLAWDSKRLPLIEKKGMTLSQSLLVQSDEGDGSDAKSSVAAFETLSGIDSATAKGAADAENRIIGHSMEKITCDAMDKTTYAVSQVKTSDEVMNVMQVETSLVTEITTTNGEVAEVAADTVNGISVHSLEKTNGDICKFVEDATDTDKR